MAYLGFRGGNENDCEIVIGSPSSALSWLRRAHFREPQNIACLQAIGKEKKKNLKNRGSIFNFHPEHLQPNTFVNYFSELVWKLLLKKRPLFLGFARDNLDVQREV